MSRRSVQPNSFCVRPKDFGKADPIEWNLQQNGSGLGGLEAQAMAAKVQHRIALRIRQKLSDRRLTIARFALMAGISPDFAGKILSGIKAIRLEDIEAADQVLGEISDWSVREQERVASTLLDARQLSSTRTLAVRDEFAQRINIVLTDLFRPTASR